MCCVGSYGKRKENTSVAWERFENTRKTVVLRGNLWKTQGGTHLLRGNQWTITWKHTFCAGTNEKQKGNTGDA